MRIVDDLYGDLNELKTKIHKFAEEFAPKGVHRGALKDIKENLHAETLKVLNEKTYTRAEIDIIGRVKL